VLGATLVSAKRASARLFVAVYPPPDVAERLLGAMHACGWTGPDLAPTPLDQVHITLLFIGDTPARNVPEVIESVERACAGIAPFELRPIGLATLPIQGPPRVIAALTDVPPVILELQRRLVIRLARNVKVRSRAGQGHADFVPHLTLARFSGLAGSSGFDATLDAGAFTVRRLRVMRSILRPALRGGTAGGATHAEAAALELRQL